MSGYNQTLSFFWRVLVEPDTVCPTVLNEVRFLLQTIPDQAYLNEIRRLRYELSLKNNFFYVDFP
jgi:hypothetical protein